MTDQPEALRLAEMLETSWRPIVFSSASATELRRQHDEIKQLKAERDALLAALQDIAKYTSETHPNNLAQVLDENASIARAAIDAARGET